MKVTRPTDSPTSAVCATDGVCGPADECGCDQRAVAARSELEVSGSAETPWVWFTVLGVLSTVAYILIVGILTAGMPSPFFARKLSADGWNIASLVIPAVLFGPLAATYLVPWPSRVVSAAVLEPEGHSPSWRPVARCATDSSYLPSVRPAPPSTSAPCNPALGALSVGLLGIALQARWLTRPGSAAAAHGPQTAGSPPLFADGQS